jgi:hypothetical protein
VAVLRKRGQKAFPYTLPPKKLMPASSIISPNFPDNGKMDEQEKQAYTNFVKNAWARATNLAKGKQLDNTDYVLLKDKTNGYSHTQSQFFYRHMFNSHSDVETEAKQGQIAIQETDFGFIPGIIESPTFKVDGIKYKGNNCVLYGQTTKTAIHTFT